MKLHAKFGLFLILVILSVCTLVWGCNCVLTHGNQEGIVISPVLILDPVDNSSRIAILENKNLPLSGRIACLVLLVDERLNNKVNEIVPCLLKVLKDKEDDYVLRMWIIWGLDRVRCAESEIMDCFGDILTDINEPENLRRTIIRVLSCITSEVGLNKLMLILEDRDNCKYIRIFIVETLAEMGQISNDIIKRFFRILNAHSENIWLRASIANVLEYMA